MIMRMKYMSNEEQIVLSNLDVVSVDCSKYTILDNL
jgi:hypothetical protein